MNERPARSPGGLIAIPWRRPMTGRDPGQDHRAATPLELFLDLCFVVAVGRVALEWEHALATGHAGSGVLGYLLVFFAIWWAWMNFTWFASAFDVDDVPYRFCTMIIMAGVLVLAAGVGPAFADLDFSGVFVGYMIMRVGLEAQRLRAARSAPGHRRTMLRYAAGETGCLGGWAVVIFALPSSLLVIGFLVMAAAELLVPVWAERAETIPWHPGHIAERYGLFTIIVLGEVIISSTAGVAGALTDHAGADLYLIAVGGLLTVFAMWWMYFSMSAAGRLNGLRTAIIWGYGHYVVFAAGAAVGAGLGVNVALAIGEAETSTMAAGAALTVPVAIYLVMVWLLQVRPHGPAAAPASWTIPLTGVPVLATTFTPYPVPLTGALLTLLVIVGAVLHATKGERTSAGVEGDGH